MEVSRETFQSGLRVVWFGFHARETLIEAWRKGKWSFLGHVEVWGETDDGIFFAFDPRSSGTRFFLTTNEDLFDAFFGAKIDACEKILRFYPGDDKIGLPFHPTMNCASQCGHLVGLRAYTPKALQRILLEHGAMEIGT